MSNSSVEWLFHKLWNTPKDKLNWHSILKQAKEMHTIEHLETWCHSISGNEPVFFKKYYNKTFKK